MTRIREAAKEIAEMLKKEYPLWKYHPNGTLWGACLYGNIQTRQLENIPLDGSGMDIIETIFEDAKISGVQINKSVMHVPRARDRVMHYIIKCMRNREVMQDGFISLLDHKDAQLEEIIDDRQIMHEAAEAYCGYDCLPQPDFISFLAKFNNGIQDKATGIYRPLLERLVIRYEEQKDLFDSSMTLLSQSLADKVRDKHYEANVQNRPTISKALIDAHAKYFTQTANNLPTINDGAEIVHPRLLLGKRRVILRNPSESVIDWEAYAEKIRISRKIKLNPEKIMEQQLVNLITKGIIPLYKENPSRAMEELERRKSQTDNQAESKALYTVIELLRKLETFDKSARINHTMTITRRLNGSN